MCSLIQSNLELCEITKTKYIIVQSEAADFLTRSAKRDLEQWDIVFFDPPYADDYLPVLESLGSQSGTCLQQTDCSSSNTTRKNCFLIRLECFTAPEFSSRATQH